MAQTTSNWNCGMLPPTHSTGRGPRTGVARLHRIAKSTRIAESKPDRRVQTGSPSPNRIAESKPDRRVQTGSPSPNRIAESKPDRRVQTGSPSPNRIAESKPDRRVQTGSPSPNRIAESKPDRRVQTGSPSPNRTTSMGHWTASMGHWTASMGHWTASMGHWTASMGHRTTSGAVSAATRPWGPPPPGSLRLFANHAHLPSCGAANAEFLRPSRPVRRLGSTSNGMGRVPFRGPPPGQLSLFATHSPPLSCGASNAESQLLSVAVCSAFGGPPPRCGHRQDLCACLAPWPSPLWRGPCHLSRAWDQLQMAYAGAASPQYLRQLAEGLLAGKLGNAMAAVIRLRLSEDSPMSTHVKAMQVALNDVARTITGSRRVDHIGIPDLMSAAKLTSINHCATVATAMEMSYPTH
eukprot:maker-scaffold378_size191342-snap-gene-0.21 protein:Tk03489 transcript:maker-scaffold378_size191342-snap-gene-0.21-mRNA-1 annotation:"hypothetical protein JCGZ_25970"